jgi:DNA-directed RNA polymerase specialized sigma24 family protein
VYDLGFHLTGSWSTAEDVASLTFLKAWRLRTRVDTAEQGGSLRPWLLGIANLPQRRPCRRRYAEALVRLPKNDQQLEADVRLSPVCCASSAPLARRWPACCDLAMPD